MGAILWKGMTPIDMLNSVNLNILTSDGSIGTVYSPLFNNIGMNPPNSLPIPSPFGFSCVNGTESARQSSWNPVSTFLLPNGIE